MQDPIANDFVNLMGQSRVNQLGRRFINGRPLPMQTRHLIVRMHNEGVKPCNISRKLQVSHGAVSKILNRYAETGSIEPGKIGGNPRCRLAIQSVQGHIQSLIRARPGASAVDICEALVEAGVCTRDNVPTACSINRHLRARGLKRRKSLAADASAAGVKESGNETWISDWAGVGGSGSCSGSSGSVDSHLSPGPSLALANHHSHYSNDDNFDNDFLIESNNNDYDNDNNNNDNNEEVEEVEADLDVDISSVSDEENENRMSAYINCASLSLSSSSPAEAREKSPAEAANTPLPSTSRLTYGINAILGSTTTNCAKMSNCDFSSKEQFNCGASTSAPSPMSDEENRPRSSCDPKPQKCGAAVGSPFTAALPDSSTSPHSTDPGPPRSRYYGSNGTNGAGAGSRPLDAFTKWAESTGGMAEYRRNRTSFTSDQLRIMEESFQLNSYPDEEERQRLIRCTNLDDDKIITWFSNRRARYRKHYMKNFPMEFLKSLEEQIGPLPAANSAQLGDYLRAVLDQTIKLPKQQSSSLLQQQQSAHRLEMLSHLIQQQQQQQVPLEPQPGIKGSLNPAQILMNPNIVFAQQQQQQQLMISSQIQQQQQFRAILSQMQQQQHKQQQQQQQDLFAAAAALLPAAPSAAPGSGIPPIIALNPFAALPFAFPQ